MKLERSLNQTKKELQTTTDAEEVQKLQLRINALEDDLAVSESSLPHRLFLSFKIFSPVELRKPDFKLLHCQAKIPLKIAKV